jgi:hypothetical protein
MVFMMMIKLNEYWSHLPKNSAATNVFRRHRRWTNVNQTGAQFIVITDAGSRLDLRPPRGYKFGSQFCGSLQLTHFYAAKQCLTYFETTIEE